MPASVAAEFAQGLVLLSFGAFWAHFLRTSSDGAEDAAEVAESAEEKLMTILMTQDLLLE